MSDCSLLVPCHNAERFLPRLWQTVTAQTVPFGEAVVYDDGSNDRTAEVAAALGARVIRGDERRGPAHARNQLARHARCPWVHFHDADDLLEPDFVRTMQEAASAAVDVALCDVDWVDESSGRVVLHWGYDDQALRADPLGYAIAHPIGGINGMYRREALLAMGGFDEALACWEDADVHVRLAAAGARFTAVERQLCVAMRRPGSQSDDQRRCNRIRLQLLQQYATRHPTVPRDLLAAQLERVAAAALRHGDSATARDAVATCITLGHPLPITRHPAMKLAARMLPPLAAIRLRQAVHAGFQAVAAVRLGLRAGIGSGGHSPARAVGGKP